MLWTLSGQAFKTATSFGSTRRVTRAYRPTSCKWCEVAPMLDRRSFLRSSAAVSLSTALPADLMAQAANSPAPASSWDAGAVRHLIPTVSDSRMLIKVSFNAPLTEAPMLSVGGTSIRGRMGDTRGEHWHFYATDLQPG